MFGATKLAAFVALSAAPAAYAFSLRSLADLTAINQCNVENGIDYVGNDVGNAQGALDTCCSRCATQPNCNAWSWSNYNGGTCWFKSARGTTIAAVGVISAARVTQPDCPAPEVNVDYVDNDLTSRPSPTADGCCALCRQVTGCNAYSWSNQNQGTCYLKSGKGASIAKNGVISGLVGAAPPPPPAMCNAQENLDYVGNDIGNKASTTAGGCCQICKDTANCRAYSWNNDNGGTCYLKNGKTGTTANGSVWSSSLIAKCDWERGIDYVGNDIGKARGPVESCCGKCSDFPGCRAYSWNLHEGGTCYFKSGKGQTANNAGVISSVVYY